MRFKYSVETDKPYRCCFCCHVRTGTAILGLFHLILHSALFFALVTVFICPKQAQDYDRRLMLALDLEANQSHEEGILLQHKTWSGEDKFLSVLLTGAMIFLTFMLIYGTVRGRASYLVPFFCLQMFDFCVTALVFLGYISYIPDLKSWFSTHNVPYSAEIAAMNADALMLIVVAVAAVILVGKAYLLGVVWSCYKYLLSVEQQALYGGSFEMDGYNQRINDDAEMLLPPKYEDVIHMPIYVANEPPPPPYSNN